MADSFSRYINEEYLPKIQKNPNFIKKIDPDIVTPEICLAALTVAAGDSRLCKWIFKKFPQFMDEKLYKTAVSGKPAFEAEEDDLCDIPGEGYGSIKYFDPVLKFVPTQYRTFDVCIAAVKYDERALKYVPAQMQVNHPEICVTAGYDALELVCQSFWSSHPFGLFEGRYTLEYMSEKNQIAHPDIVKQLLAKYPSDLEHVSKSFRKKYPNLIMDTGKQAPASVQHLNANEQKRVLESCIKYIEQNPKHLQYIKPGVQVLIADTCIKAVKSDLTAFKYLAPGLQSQCGVEYLVNVANAYFECFKCITKNILEQHSEICMAAIAKYRTSAIEYLRDQNVVLTETAYKTIAKEYPGFVKHFPKKYRTNDMWNITMDAQPYYVLEAPRQLRTIERYKGLMKDWSVYFDKIPLKQRSDYELCKLAVEQHNENLQHVPAEIISEHIEMCYPVLDKEPSNIGYVSGKIQLQHPEVCQYAMARARFMQRYDWDKTQSEKREKNVMNAISKQALKANWTLIMDTEINPVPQQWLDEYTRYKKALAEDMRNMFRRR